jgi:succinyl-diaminopimelate desuccinylase
MKGGLAVMLALIEDLDLDTLRHDLAWVFYDAEEGPFDGSGLGPLLEAVDWLKEVDLAFCLEPSDNVVQVGCVGTLHARVTFHGRSAHSARPWQGENAVHKAGSLLQDLAALAPRDVDCGGHIFKEVMSITQAKGGRARNVVPESFEMNLNYRFAPNRTLAEACAQVESLVAGRADVVIVDQSPAGRVVTDNPHFQEFVAQTGVSVTSKQAWTDVARLAQVGVDAVNFGPGNSPQAHQAGETADIGLLADSYHLFRRFLSPEG